jgi:hypothetical protein
MSNPAPNASLPPFIETSEATAIIPMADSSLSPVTVIGTREIRQTFDEICVRQARTCRAAPGVTQVVLNPDAHCGYGAPIGCVMVSPSHIYPGPVGVDIKCSMSLLQFDLPESAVNDKKLRRALINAILERTPTGAGRGQRVAPKSRRVDRELGERAVIEGASAGVLADLGVPVEWAARCEDSFHVGHDGTADALRARLERFYQSKGSPRELFHDKVKQLGSYGGGNHFGECEIVEVQEIVRGEWRESLASRLAGRQRTGEQHGRVSLLHSIRLLHLNSRFHTHARNKEPRFVKIVLIDDRAYARSSVQFSSVQMASHAVPLFLTPPAQAIGRARRGATGMAGRAVLTWSGYPSAARRARAARL